MNQGPHKMGRWHVERTRERSSEEDLKKNPNTRRWPMRRDRLRDEDTCRKGLENRWFWTCQQETLSHFWGVTGEIPARTVPPLGALAVLPSPGHIPERPALNPGTTSCCRGTGGRDRGTAAFLDSQMSRRMTKPGPPLIARKDGMACWAAKGVLKDRKRPS